MLIDFTKLRDLIPPGGNVTFTVRTTKDGNLGVLYKATHSLTKVGSHHDKDIKADITEVAGATRELSRPMAFTGSSSELTESFERLITQGFNTEKTLVDAIELKTSEINERIKALSGKKATPTKGPVKPAIETKSKEAELPLMGSLFGAEAPAPAPQPEETPAEEETTEEPDAEHDDETEGGEE
ncbi:MAG: hypothetical protein WC291_02955 [Thermodesulfovibrionales bacterium]